MLGSFVNNTLANYTDVLFNPMAKEIIASAVNDTNQVRPKEEQIDIAGYEKAQGTEQVFEGVQEEMTLGNVVGILDTFFADEDSPEASGWWGMFKEGLSNSGQQRKGDRGN